MTMQTSHAILKLNVSGYSLNSCVLRICVKNGTVLTNLMQALLNSWSLASSPPSLLDFVLISEILKGMTNHNLMQHFAKDYSLFCWSQHNFDSLINNKLVPVIICISAAISSFCAENLQSWRPDSGKLDHYNALTLETPSKDYKMTTRFDLFIISLRLRVMFNVSV